MACGMTDYLVILYAHSIPPEKSLQFSVTIECCFRVLLGLASAKVHTCEEIREGKPIMVYVMYHILLAWLCSEYLSSQRISMGSGRTFQTSLSLCEAQTD